MKEKSSPSKKQIKKIKIRQVRSIIGTKPVHRKTVRALGLKRIGHVVEKDDRPEIRGMVNRVKHLVEIEEVKE